MRQPWLRRVLLFAILAHQRVTEAVITVAQHTFEVLIAMRRKARQAPSVPRDRRARADPSEHISNSDGTVPTHGIGVNYNAGIWHFPLISTEDMNFLVVDRKGSGENLIIENLDKDEIVLKY